MDYKELAIIAERAFLHVLNYCLTSTNNGRPLAELDQPTRDLIEAHIQKLLPLKAHAEDELVANLEIACDAPVTAAEKFNVEERWFYIAFQAMVSNEFVPALHADNTVRRLSLSMLDALKKNQDAQQDGQQDEDQEGNTQSLNSLNAPKKSRNEAWTDDDVRKLIAYKLEGWTSPAISKAMDRSTYSVCNKWHNANTKPNSEWKDFIQQQFRAKEDNEKQALAKTKEQSEEVSTADENSAAEKEATVVTEAIKAPEAIEATERSDEEMADYIPVVVNWIEDPRHPPPALRLTVKGMSQETIVAVGPPSNISILQYIESCSGTSTTNIPYRFDRKSILSQWQDMVLSSSGRPEDEDVKEFHQIVTAGMYDHIPDNMEKASEYFSVPNIDGKDTVAEPGLKIKSLQAQNLCQIYVTGAYKYVGQAYLQDCMVYDGNLAEDIKRLARESSDINLL
ncbi:hypothetical protein diail_258 [Diaporthe ilicicola]|nr:hypothetical protein diail_258 [Diaporthe ilicicola]